MNNLDVYDFIIKELTSNPIDVVVVSKNRKDTIEKIKNMIPKNFISGYEKKYSLELKNSSRVHSNTIDPRNLLGLSIKYVILEGNYSPQEIENFNEFVVPVVACNNGTIFSI